MIRHALTADRARISEVRNAVRENQLGPSKVSTVADTARWIYDNGTFWVWEEDGAVPGFAVADPRDGTIFGLFVHPSYEGRGIARALLPLACSDLRRERWADRLSEGSERRLRRPSRQSLVVTAEPEAQE